MVLGSFEKHIFGPRREAINQAKEAKARAEAMLAEGRAWNERRRQAKARGEPFDEPLPGAEEAEGHTRGTGDQKMPGESTQSAAPKIWRHNVGRAEFILRPLSESLVKVTYRDQVGYIGINRNRDAEKPYTWLHMDRMAEVSRADVERYTSPDGIHGNLFGEATPEEALSVLCDIQLQVQRKEDPQRANSEERKVLREFLDELPDWKAG